MTFNPGDSVRIPVSVSAGPFDRERLVTFDTADGPVSGFVPKDRVYKMGEDDFIEARVIRVLNDDAITVNVAGSFFTTTGVAHISKHLLLEAA